MCIIDTEAEQVPEEGHGPAAVAVGPTSFEDGTINTVQQTHVLPVVMNHCRNLLFFGIFNRSRSKLVGEEVADGSVVIGKGQECWILFGL